MSNSVAVAILLYKSTVSASAGVRMVAPLARISLLNHLAMSKKAYVKRNAHGRPDRNTSGLSNFAKGTASNIIHVSLLN